MKLKLFLVISIISTMLVSCKSRETYIEQKTNDNIENKTKTSSQININQQSSNKPKTEYDQIEELMNKYEKGLIEAINNNNFSLVELYLTEGSPLYKSQKNLVKNLYTKGIKEEYVTHDLGYVYFISKNIFKVEVVETIKIKNPQKCEEKKDFQWIYTITNADKTMKLSQIEKWKNFEKDIEKLEGSVKADGYYTDEVIYEGYDNALINKLNNNDDELDNLLGNNEVTNKQLDLIRTLRDKGSSFNLISSEVLDDNRLENMEGKENLPYKAKKKLKLSYIDKNSNKKELSLVLTLDLEEHRTGYMGLFGGYAKIIDIMSIEIE